MSHSRISSDKVVIRLLTETDLPEADRIFRVSFGTFLGLPNPMDFAGDTDYIRTRWKANPAGAIGAEINGKLVGIILGTLWGSVGFFGPLSIDPAFWDRGVAQQLVAPMMKYLRDNGVKHAGLFTFSNSAKHLGLYQKFGFSPRHLTAIMAKTVAASNPQIAYARLSAMDDIDQETIVQDCRALANQLYEQLDLSAEIRATADQKLGDTIVLTNGGRVEGFAVCHLGAGTEAGSGTCYLKFAAIRPGIDDASKFADLLRACESFAADSGTQRVVAGVNTACAEAYRHMLSAGFRMEIIGVAMHAPNEPGYLRPGIYACGDWR